MKIKGKAVLLFLFAIILAGIIFVSTQDFSPEKKAIKETKVRNPVKIAVCPTFYKTVTSLEDWVYQIKNNSTADSISLLTTGEVDYVLAGRVLKPGEKMFPLNILGSGYSFLSWEEKTITEEELSNLNVYTDIDVKEVGQVFGLDNVSGVSDVYNYLGKGIVITSWNNTDYSLAEPVHLVDKNGNRNPKSRIPILYCSNICDEKLVDLLKASLTII